MCYKKTVVILVQYSGSLTMKISLSVGKSLKRYRRLAGISQSELAERAGCSVKTIGNIERGKVIPDLKQLVALSRITALSLDELVFDEKTAAAEERKDSLQSLIRSLGPEEIAAVENVLLLMKRKK